MGEAVFDSVHLPPVGGTDAEGARTRQIFGELDEAFHRWKRRRTTWRWLVVGMDANVQVPSDTEDITGPRVHAAPKATRAHRARVDGCRVQV